MGAYYVFDAKEIDGTVVYGFTYQNERSGFNPIFVEFTDEQKIIADDLKIRIADLEVEIEKTIESWMQT